MMARPSARYLALAAMTLLYLLLTAGTFNALGVVLPLMVADIGMNWAAAGLGFTLLGVACGIASLAPAFTIRHAGVSATLAIGAFVLTTGFGALALAHTASIYHLGTLLLGLGFCFCGTVPGVYVISTLFERRAAAMGIYFGAGGLGSVIGPILFYGVRELFGDWRVFWIILAVATVLLGSFAAFVTTGWKNRRIDPVVPGAVTAEIGGWTAREALRLPQYWVVVGAYTSCLLINTTMHSFAVQHLGERGVSLGAAAGLVSAAALVAAVASAVAGVVGERVSARRLTMAALLSLAVAAVALVMPQSWASLALFALAVGLGIGTSYVGINMLLLDWFGGRANLELYSVMCVASTAAAIGPGLGGIERDHSGNFVAVFLTLASIAAVMIAMIAVVRRPSPSRAEPLIDLPAEFA